MTYLRATRLLCLGVCAVAITVLIQRANSGAFHRVLLVASPNPSSLPSTEPKLNQTVKLRHAPTNTSTTQTTLVPATLLSHLHTPQPAASNATPIAAPGLDHAEKLRGLFLGTSRTYGTHIGQSARLENAFAFNTFRDSENLGIPCGSATYPSQCAHTMLSPVERNDSFDVIVMEFETELPRALHLANRLRQRYPKAHIIFLNIWVLVRYQHIPTGMNMKQWFDKQLPGFLDSVSDKFTKEAMGKLSTVIKEKTSSEDWRYMQAFGKENMMKEEFPKHGVRVVNMAFPENAHDAIGHAGLFVGDLNHFSVTGHHYIKRIIHFHLRVAKIRKHHDPTIGTWDDLDQCEMWLRTGNTTLEYDKDNIVINQFSPNKYALEVTGAHAWIKVENKGRTDQRISLSRMVATPQCHYPNTKVTIFNSKNEPIGTTIASCPKSAYNFQVNVMNDLDIGTLPPGVSIISMERLQEGKPWPFRIVGLSITGTTSSVASTS